MFSSFDDQPLEKQVDASGDDSGVILVLLHVTQEGHLLFFVIFTGRLTSDYVVPITSEHSMRLSAACLPIGKQRNVVTLHSLHQQRFNYVKDLPLRGFRGEGELYLFKAAKSSDFDLESGLI